MDSYENAKNYIEGLGRTLSTERKNYVNQHSSVLVSCKCGELYQTTVNAFKTSEVKLCQKCIWEFKSNNHRKSTDEMNEKIKKLSDVANVNYTWVSGEHKNSRSKLKLIDEFGYTYLTNNINISTGINRKCKLRAFHTSNPYVIYNIKLWLVLHNSKYKLVSNVYEKSKSKLIWSCETHGLFEMSFDHMKQGNNCAKCTGDKLSNLFRLSYDEVKQTIESEKYTLLSDKYINAHIPLLIMCDQKHTYVAAFNTFCNGHRCPTCSETKGEKKCRQFMELNNIPFEPQHTFPDLLSDKGNPLKFDFAVFEDTDKTKLKYLLEYDGEFHFMKLYEDDGYELTKYHDQLKNTYCSIENNNIPLLRIPYWEFDNIESIISNYISELDNQQQAI